MTAPYKKRAKAGWNSDKTLSNRSERVFEAEDISEQQLEETPHKAKKKQSSDETRKIKRMMSDIKFAIKLSRGDIESLNVHGDSWIDGMRQEYYQKAKKAVEILKEKLELPLEAKLKRQIEETLEKL